jgi:hypothetical protein
MGSHDAAMGRRESLKKGSATGIGFSAATLVGACGPTSIPLPTEEMVAAPAAPVVLTEPLTQAPATQVVELAPGPGAMPLGAG